MKFLVINTFDPVGDIDRNIHQHQLITGSSAELGDPINNSQTAAPSRWTPTPEQITTLVEVYRRETRTTEQIQQIASKLRKYGRIESKNVFYWFQDHKAIERELNNAVVKEMIMILTTFVNHFKTHSVRDKSLAYGPTEASFGPSKLLTVHHRVPPATPVDRSDYLRHQTPHRRRNSPQTDNEAGRTISTKRSNPLSKGTTKNFLKDPSLSPSQIPLGIPAISTVRIKTILPLSHGAPSDLLCRKREGARPRLATQARKRALPEKLPSLQLIMSLATEKEASEVQPLSSSQPLTRDNFEKRPTKDLRETLHHRAYKDQPKTWQERSSYRRSNQARERTRGAGGRSTHSYRASESQRYLPPPPNRSYYREVPRKGIDTKDTGSSVSKQLSRPAKGGNPPENENDLNSVPHAALQAAIGEVRDVMLQYTRAADPTEREARIERVRQVEERGELEEAALHMLQASNNTISKDNTPANATPERLSASHRLGPAPQSHSTDRRKYSAYLSTDNRERLPGTLRLGPPPLELGQLSNERSEIQTVTTTERVPAPLRLGPLNLENEETRVVPEPEPTKRKPGRPPGPRKNTGENPSSKTRVIASKRKVTQKPSPIRRKITAYSEGTTTIKKKTGRAKTGGTSRAGFDENLPRNGYSKLVKGISCYETVELKKDDKGCGVNGGMKDAEGLRYTNSMP
ncbi:hypothetical protein HID58_076461 [Brassica napus]|uniref:Homeobox domain-containing protein n=1 Tax=Brassica napus TaxID=3708 RepID=A0ABQ7YMJ8_BRANA|nr:hypothetical protein HID58_076461 [Brassica napus]